MQWNKIKEMFSMISNRRVTCVSVQKVNSTATEFTSQYLKHCQRHNGPEGWVLLTKVREGVKKIDFFLGKSPKLWVGGGQES